MPWINKINQTKLKFSPQSYMVTLAEDQVTTSLFITLLGNLVESIITCWKSIRQAELYYIMLYYIQDQIDKINLVEEIQSRRTWQTVNKESVWKSTPRAKLKPTNQKETFPKWIEYFKNLLGNPLEMTDEHIQKVNG